MSSEHPDGQTIPIDKSSQALSILRWAGIAVALILLLPVLFMSSMMLMMGLIGPPMHGGMAGLGPGLVPVIGVLPLLLIIGVIYGMYRLYAADTR